MANLNPVEQQIAEALRLVIARYGKDLPRFFSEIQPVDKREDERSLERIREAISR